MLQGSTAVSQERQSAKKWPYVIALRKQLIVDGTLVQKDGFYRFTRDVEFSSPSAAAAVNEGGSANGLNEWRTKVGLGALILSVIVETPKEPPPDNVLALR